MGWFSAGNGSRYFFIFSFLVSAAVLVFLSRQVSNLEERERSIDTARYVSEKPGWLVEVHGNPAFQSPAILAQTVARLDLTPENFPAIGREKVSAHVKGFLWVEEPGVYSFELGSDDGAVLLLNGRLFLNNSGSHPYRSKKGKIRLEKGWHAAHVWYRNEAGPARLTLSWGRKGEPRRVVGGEEVRLPQGLPPTGNPFPGLLSLERVRLNAWRGAALAGILLFASLFFWGKRIAAFWKTGEAWGAAAVLILAFVLRWTHFASHLELRIQGIVDGGDNFYFLTLPLKFESWGQFISVKCGNLPLLIPLLGTIYKYFCFSLGFTCTLS